MVGLIINVDAINTKMRLCNKYVLIALLVILVFSFPVILNAQGGGETATLCLTNNSEERVYSI